ncbi:MAG: DUF697 domain-containing protein [Magnetococcales bacterium]|nr:DUF697 domain-containing protein [Magnetococcales bacterium]
MNSDESWIAPVALTVNAPKETEVETSLLSASPVVLPISGERREDAALGHEFKIPSTPRMARGMYGWFQDRGAIGFILGGLLWLAGIFLEETYLFLWERFHQHWALGIFFFVVAGTTLVAAALLITGEIRGFSSLRRAENLRLDIQRMWERRGHGHAVGVALRLRETMVGDAECESDWKNFNNLVRSHYDDHEVLELLSRTVYGRLDARGYRLIVKHATTMAVASAMSPMIGLNGLFFLWQNLRMIRSIACCYGIHPGGMASLYLTREVLLGTFMVGTTDLVVDRVSDVVGGHAASLVLAQAGKGVANGLFTARIGLAAMNRCRLVPFHAGGEPSLERIRVELFNSLGGSK